MMQNVESLGVCILQGGKEFMYFVDKSVRLQKNSLAGEICNEYHLF
jgi:hypothetical protein